MKNNFIETGSVVFHRVGSVKFWLTSTNRVFITVPEPPGQRVIFPHLHGAGIVKFDDPTYKPGPLVQDALCKILRKQREVRLNLPSFEEDSVAWEFN